MVLFTNHYETWVGHRGGVIEIALIEAGRFALTASADSTIKRWDTKTGVCLATWNGHDKAVIALAVSADYPWALSSSMDATIRRWNILTDHC